MKRYILNYKAINLCAVLIYSIVLFSCKSIEVVEKHEQEKIIEETPDTITITFSGDIMAHDVNYNMKNYNLIYDDVRELLTTDDLTFGNMEMPVCDKFPLSSFPSFNVHSDYLRAAIDGGFDVFSFANNHTNDKGIKGIDGTLFSILKLKNEYATKNRNIFSSGLKQKVGDPFEACIIEKNGWKILFLAITEILNSHDSSKNRLYFSNPSQKGREKLLEEIKKLREQNECDLFVLSLHLNEPEYGLKVLQSKTAWFKQLASAGVDIIWANHPHVLQNWQLDSIPLNTANKINSDQTEKPQTNEQATRPVVFMNSLGNFISAQRWSVNYKNPAFYREYTGDSILMQISVTKKNGTLKYLLNPILITNYNLPKAPCS